MSSSTTQMAKASTRPLEVFYLLPADLAVSDGGSPRTMMTILGSCVAVCLWDRRGTCGGMNHYLLPRRGPGAEATTRYGDVAIPLLVEKLLALGALRQNLRAKIFGGAHVLPGFRADGRSLGAENVEMAIQLLHAEGVQTVSEDIGGTRGRKLAFNTVDGTALVWRL
jgi:chemotaxis protein CheD